MINVIIEDKLMKTHFVLKSSLIALVASSALMAGQLYAADPVVDTGVKTTPPPVMICYTSINYNLQ